MRWWVIAVVVTALIPQAHADIASRKAAGGKRCVLGREVVLMTLPPKDVDPPRIAMGARGGLAIFELDDKFTAQPLALDGSKRGAAKPFEWPTSYLGDLIAAGDRFLAFGKDCAGYKAECMSARWIDPDGTSHDRLEIDIGARKVHIDAYPVHDRVHVLAMRDTSSAKPAKTDLWLELGRRTDGKVDVIAQREVDLLGDIRVAFQEEADGAWLFATKTTYVNGKPVYIAVYANQDGKGGAVRNWPSEIQPIAIGPKRGLLAWADANHREWIEYRIEPDGLLKEIRRSKSTKAMPAPFVDEVRASQDTAGGIRLSRTSRFGAALSDTQISTTLAPTPGDSVWANGKFFVAYGERGKRATLLKLRTATCK